jgi:hypothetical protein
VTVNSTVAIDAGVLGIPTLVIGLPNNLSPLVDAGAMAGVTGAAELGTMLHRILYDEGFRQQLLERCRVILGDAAKAADGGAAARAAQAVQELISGGARPIHTEAS